MIYRGALMVRNKWGSCLAFTLFEKLVLLSNGQLKSNLPICGNDNPERYMSSTHLEFVGRTLCGVAPFIELNDLALTGLTIDDIYQGIHSITDPESSDCLNFNQGVQPLVDTAFFCIGLYSFTQGALGGGYPH
jgi:hypothetical protein